MQTQEWKPAVMYCVNCAEKIVGYRNADGKVKVECPRCGVKYVSQRKSRRHEQIDVYAPVGQVALN